MIAQSMAQLVSSVFTLTVVFFCMLYISVWLTLIVCAVMALILVFVRKLTGRIGGYFMAQQTALADLNGKIVVDVYDVEEIPLALICQRAVSVGVHSVEGVEEVFGSSLGYRWTAMHPYALAVVGRISRSRCDRCPWGESF